MVERRKRRFSHLLCFLILLFLSGCWDRTEVNDLAIVTAVGLDKTDDGQIELSVQIINPGALGGSGSGGASGGKLSTVEKDTGRTIYDARSKLQQKVSRKLFIGHNPVVFIGEKMAEEGIRSHIEYFARSPFPRLRTFAFVTKGSPVDFLKVSPDLERNSGEVARELAKFQVGMSVTMKDLLLMLTGEERGAALPLIEIEEEPPDTIGLRVNGTAIFQNGKMIEQIDDKMTRGILWLRDAIETATVTIQPEDAEGLISFYIFRANTSLVPTIENGNWKMTVNIKSLDDVMENETKLNLMNPDTVEKLEVQLEETIDERIHEALEKIQNEMNVDIFNFGRAFHRHYPDQWAMVKDNWEEKLPEVEVEIQSNVEIERPGRSTSPQGVPEDEVIEQ
ncbi:Ger(x)C family spore germination protein [Virgibacillus ainsalahensis]